MFSDCRRGQSPGLAEQRHVVRNGRRRCSVFRPNEARWERPEIRLIDAVIEPTGIPQQPSATTFSRPALPFSTVVNTLD